MVPDVSGAAELPLEQAMDVATAHKNRGNQIYARKEEATFLQEALMEYQEGTGILLRADSSIADLGIAGLTLLAQLRVNTAQIHLDQAAAFAALSTHHHKQSNAAGRRAQLACVYVLDHPVFQATAQDLPSSLLEKARWRLSQAVDVMFARPQSTPQPTHPSFETQPLQQRRQRPPRQSREPSAAARASQQAKPQRCEIELASDAVISAASSEDALVWNSSCPCCLREWRGAEESGMTRLVVLLRCNGPSSPAHAMCVTCLYEWWQSSKDPGEGLDGERFHTRPTCALCRSDIETAAIAELPQRVLHQLPEEDLDNLLFMSQRIFGLSDDAGMAVLEELAMKDGGNIALLYESMQRLGVMALPTSSSLSHSDKQRIYHEARAEQHQLEDKIASLRTQLIAGKVAPEQHAAVRKQLHDAKRALPGVTAAAALAVFRRMNEFRDGGLLTVDGMHAMDMHGQSVRDVPRIILEEVVPLMPVLKRVVLITGRGAHNPDGLAPLRDKVCQEVEKAGLSWRPMPRHKDGCIIVCYSVAVG